MVEFRASTRQLRAVPRTCLCLLICFGLMSACKTSEDATATASQMATTSQDLVAYYSALTNVMDNTIKLEQLQNAFFGTPFDSQDLEQLQQTEQELQKRSDAAKALQSLSASLSKLTGSTVNSDASTAANKLAAELVTIKALPTGPPVPAATSLAAQAITMLVKEHDERKAAAQMDSAVSAVSSMFTAEKPAYESLYNSYIELAGSLALESIKRNWVDESGLLMSALQPFGLSAGACTSAAGVPAADAKAAGVPSQNRSAVLNSYAQKQLLTQIASQKAAQTKASEGMENALREMTKRIHALATENAMSMRGSPVSLADVEAWVAKL